MIKFRLHHKVLHIDYILIFFGNIYTSNIYTYKFCFKILLDIFIFEQIHYFMH